MRITNISLSFLSALARQQIDGIRNLTLLFIDIFDCNSDVIYYCGCFQMFVLIGGEGGGGLKNDARVPYN